MRHALSALLLAALGVNGFELAAVRSPLAAHGARRIRRPPAACDDAAVATPQIVTFSDAAMKQLKSLRDEAKTDDLLLRMGVRAGGCSGMSYVMDMSKPEDVSDEDTLVDVADGIRCHIDPKSLLFLFGLYLDYSDELIGGGFSFNNPNADETCGCGAPSRDARAPSWPDPHDPPGHNKLRALPWFPWIRQVFRRVRPRLIGGAHSHTHTPMLFSRLAWSASLAKEATAHTLPLHYSMLPRLCGEEAHHSLDCTVTWELITTPR